MISPADSEQAEKEQKWLWTWNQQRLKEKLHGRKATNPWVLDASGRPYCLRSHETCRARLLPSKSLPSMAVTHYATENRRAFQLETSILGSKYTPTKPRFNKR
ncbi:unnamed protein product [Cladocopium goreaui]|uniref:Peroxisomal membrane protein PEX14 (Peroxin-14) n=1 Tax=Cladocopium goreaui TaxID=2562237 RepID=A0A9P1BPY4_9DINO|nr:unnamed protein product [Cladocopium goreaui]